MYSLLLLQTIQNLGRFQKISIANLPQHTKKLECATNKLKKLGKELNQPLRLLIFAYADYYVNLFKEKTLHSIYAKIDQFVLLSNIETAAKFTEEEVDTALILMKDWNEMNDLMSNDLPFTLHNQFTMSGIQIRINTFFRHSSAFLTFCFAAKYVEANRLNYPEISSMKEFFAHLPLVTKFARDYNISEYINPDATLDKYYRMVYDNINKEDRLPKFLSVLYHGSAKAFKKSQMWGAKAAYEHLLKLHDQAQSIS